MIEYKQLNFLSFELLRLGCEAHAARGMKLKTYLIPISVSLNFNFPFLFLSQSPISLSDWFEGDCDPPVLHQFWYQSFSFQSPSNFSSPFAQNPRSLLQKKQKRKE